MATLYSYVGPDEILEGLDTSGGFWVASTDSLRAWLKTMKRDWTDRELTVTFIIDGAGRLRVADRHSEHVACAQGQSVRAAGEMTFAIDTHTVHVVGVTNQSTGYCPEPESWSAVRDALLGAGLVPPEGWTHRFIFRRCSHCGARNIVKDAWFACAECEAELPLRWNF